MLKLEELNSKIKTLETENTQLKATIEKIDKAQRKKNLVVFGLNSKESTKPIDFTCKTLKQLLGIEISCHDISDAYWLGTPSHKILKIELISYQSKKLILQNANKLKGTKIVIAQDLTKLQQIKNKILRRHLRQARESTKEICYIKGDKLYVGAKEYTSEDLEDIEDTDFTTKKPSSAPTTPIITWQKPEEDTEEVIEVSAKQKPKGSADTPKTTFHSKIHSKANIFIQKTEKPRTRSNR